MIKKENIFSFTLEELKEKIIYLGLKKFIATQIYE
jgi:adenine C2-methylase RlmN of 23S rRNA A2503 and tRNA A37